MEYAEVMRELANERHQLKEAQRAMYEAEARLRQRVISKNGGIKMMGTNEAEQKRALEMHILDDERCGGYREVVAELEREVSMLQAELDIYNERTKTARWALRARLLAAMEGELNEGTKNLVSLFEELLTEMIDDRHLPTVEE